ncbi:MAG: hypothetical protein VB861_14830 [Planctomycetaceae bacterium]
MTDQARWCADVARRIVLGTLAIVVCLGCTDDPSVDSSVGTTETAANRKRRRSDVLKTLMEMSQPETLAIRTRRVTVVSLLNDWVSMSGSRSGASTSETEIDAIYVSRLDNVLVERLRASRFSKRDVTHIRDALWYSRISKRVASAAKTDLDRATRLFDYVVRNIVLRSDEDTRLPLAPFGIAMFGEGNAKDRAWLFINLLRQLRIDGVVLRSSDLAESPAGGLLVGVLLDGKLYLYDPLLGLPVPAVSATKGVSAIRPATLSEAIDNPAVLDSLATPKGVAYRFTSKSLSSVCVSLVGATSYWAPRMRPLQLALSSDNDALLWHPLEPSDIVPEGALARVAKVRGEGFSEDAITIWEYPEQRLDGNSTLNAQQLQIFRLRSRAFESPIAVTRILANRETREVKLEVSAKGQFRHRMSRNRQLLGEWQTAVTTYLKVRMWRDVPPLPKAMSFIERRDQARFKALLPTRVRLIHEEAADDAGFWTAVCQYELGRVASAANAQREYRERSGPHEWESGSVWLEGLWRGELEQWGEAVSLLETISEGDPHRGGADVLLRRWRPLAAALKKAAATGSESKVKE